VLQSASEARERKKKFSGSVEVLRFERTLELTRRQLRRTDNVAMNDARLQSALQLMFHDEAKNSNNSRGHNKPDHQAAPSESQDLLPQTSRCLHSQEKSVAHDVTYSGCVTSSVAMTTASVATVAMPSSVAVVTVAVVTASMTTDTTSAISQSFVALTTSVAKSTACSNAMSVVSMTTAVNDVSCMFQPPNTSSAVAAAAAANSVEAKFTNTTAHTCLPPSAVSITLPPTAAVTLAYQQSTDAVTVTTNKYISSVARSSDAVTVKSVDSAARRSTTSADVVVGTLGKSVDSDAVLAHAATLQSLDYVAATPARSAEAVTASTDKSYDSVVRSADAVTASTVPVASLKALPISSPVPPAGVKSLCTPQSGSPSPRGHVTFSDHVTEISAGSDGGPSRGKPRRVPPAPPPRAALKNVAAASSPRDRPLSAVEPLNGAPGTCPPPPLPGGYPAVNGGVVGRVRPLSMAPLATVDSDSDSAESQTGTIRRNTLRSAGVEARNGRGRTPPPVPARKTSSLTLPSSCSSRSAAEPQDSQYSNLADVRQDCARLLELDSERQQDGQARWNGPRTDAAAAAAAAKCEETEIY